MYIPRDPHPFPERNRFSKDKVHLAMTFQKIFPCATTGDVVIMESILKENDSSKDLADVCAFKALPKDQETIGKQCFAIFGEPTPQNLTNHRNTDDPSLIHTKNPIIGNP